MATIYSDGFAYSDGDIEVVSSGKWDRVNTWNVVSGVLDIGASGLTICSTTTSAHTAVANCQVSVKHTAAGAFDGGPGCRLQQVSDITTVDGYYLDAFGSEIGMWKYTNGSGTQVGSSGTITLTANTVLKLKSETSGSDVILTAWYGGTLECGPSTDVGGYTAAGMAGVHSWDTTGGFDDFLLEDLDAGGGVAGAGFLCTVGAGA